MIEKLNKNDNIIDVMNKINEIIDFLNENNSNCIYDNTIEAKKCPYCGESYYEELFNLTTDMYYPPIYKNGVSITNKSSTHCRCLNCGKDFTL